MTRAASPLPPLPPRDPGIPSFQPPPPPLDGSIAEDGRPISGGQLLPSPSSDSMEEDYSCSDSEDDMGPPMCISSTQGVGDRDDILLVTPSESERQLEDSYSSGSTEPSTPERRVVSSIKQSHSGSAMDDIIMVSSPVQPPETDCDDGVNLMAMMHDSGHDYANQDAIDESIKITSSAPIRSRMAKDPTDRDYENQDVINEDMIPFGVFPVSGGGSQELQRLTSTDSDLSLAVEPSSFHSFSSTVCTSPSDEETDAGFGKSIGGNKSGTFPYMVESSAAAANSPGQKLRAQTVCDEEEKSPTSGSGLLAATMANYAVSAPGTEAREFFDAVSQEESVWGGWMEVTCTM